jgi:signal transduction histidine kinase
MSEELLARLGEAFATETDGGTGLGVLLARSVAHQHGGELRYDSALGRGTTASLELPITR